jgi:hypothetical protein
MSLIQLLIHSFNLPRVIRRSLFPFPPFSPFRSRVIKEGILRIASQPPGTAFTTLYVHHTNQLFSHHLHTLFPIAMLFTFLTLLTSVMALPQPLPPPTDALPTFTSANFGMSYPTLHSHPSSNTDIQPKHPRESVGPRLPSSMILEVVG